MRREFLPHIVDQQAELTKGSEIEEPMLQSFDVEKGSKRYKMDIGVFSVEGCDYSDYGGDSLEVEARFNRSVVAHLEAKLNYKKKKAHVEVVGVSDRQDNKTRKILALEAMVYVFEQILKEKGISTIYGVTNPSLALLATNRWNYEEKSRKTVFPSKKEKKKEGKDELIEEVALEKDLLKHPIDYQTILKRQQKFLDRIF